MSTPNEKTGQAPITPVLNGDTMNEKNIHDSESSSATKTEDAERAPAQPHAHTHWGENRVVEPNDVQDMPPVEKAGTYDKIELTEDDCYDELGFGFPEWRKWMILSVIFLVQVSMNFNTSLYSNAISGSTNHPEHIGISKQFGVSEQAARCGAVIFLILYAFGCELWAPWSEELGRKPILQLSLLLVNIWQIPVALAPNFATVMVGRALGGLSSAGGSVTLGMIADMWEPDHQQYAVAFVVFSSVGGSIFGPIIGGFSQEFLDWRWSIWIQLIFGGFVQVLHMVLVPETRSTIMMDNIAKKRRKNNVDANIWGPNELVPFWDRFSAKEILITWIRPFKMFLTEPIVLTLSLLSGFSDALIFMFIQSFAIVYKQWGFGTVEIGLTFIAIGVGYTISWISFIPAIRRNIAERKAKPDDERAQYESRLWWLLYTAPCLPIGLIGFAWTCTGPPIHWIGSMIFAAIVGIANYAIYMATIDYMICAYGPYSASATGGNGWSRDFLAGVLTVPATPFFSNIGSNPLAYASTILFCISFVLVMAVYVIYWKGPVLRHRSPFAQQLEAARNEHSERRESRVPMGSRANSFARSAQNVSIRQNLGSRQNSYVGGAKRTPTASRKNSGVGVRGAGTPTHRTPAGSRRPSNV
ncbi:Efflux pump [Lachnellula hyalina]|uniref:Efflux pump n=1 Tax=Lachnellula hyalina TaxID=1316788 RepID=A0A8H8R9K4_9HELO|nr:Efflux pump [Lachnellula hyalina]TVY29300.1 Efflux pump [Lachnellula hyalina]